MAQATPLWLQKETRHIRFGVVAADGKLQGYGAIRATEGAPAEEHGTFTFPCVVKHDAVMDIIRMFGGAATMRNALPKMQQYLYAD